MALNNLHPLMSHVSSQLHSYNQEIGIYTEITLFRGKFIRCRKFSLAENGLD